MANDKDKKLIESLSPNELRILPYLEDKDIISICKKLSYCRLIKKS